MVEQTSTTKRLVVQFLSIISDLSSDPGWFLTQNVWADLDQKGWSGGRGFTAK